MKFADQTKFVPSFLKMGTLTAFKIRKLKFDEGSVHRWLEHAKKALAYISIFYHVKVFVLYDQVLFLVNRR